MNIQISGREKLLITALCVALILVIGMRFLVLPAYNGWVTRNAQIRALESVTGSDSPGAHGGIAENTAEAAENFAAFFLPKSTPEELHRYFAGFVSASGLDLDNIAISESSGGDLPKGFSNAHIKLALSGTQAQVMKFIEEIDSSGKAIAIDSMNLNPSGSQTVGFDVSLKAYCIDNGGDDSLDFTPPQPNNAEGFRFAARNGGDMP